MSSARTYGDACGIPRALDRVGERWALMIVRELLLGPKRFTDLQDRPSPRQPQRPLTAPARARAERAWCSAARCPRPRARACTSSPSGVWSSSRCSSALGRWGARAPLAPPETGMSLDAHILSLKTLFDPELAAGFETVLELRLGDHRFRAEVADGSLELVRRRAPGAGRRRRDRRRDPARAGPPPPRARRGPARGGRRDRGRRRGRGALRRPVHAARALRRRGVARRLSRSRARGRDAAPAAPGCSRRMARRAGRSPRARHARRRSRSTHAPRACCA